MKPDPPVRSVLTIVILAYGFSVVFRPFEENLCDAAGICRYSDLRLVVHSSNGDSGGL
jgi:hypothetical protein